MEVASSLHDEEQRQKRRRSQTAHQDRLDRRVADAVDVVMARSAEASAYIIMPTSACR